MPAPDLITRGQRVLKTQLDDLADYANSKTSLLGKPYVFTANPTLAADKWAAVMKRMRRYFMESSRVLNNVLAPFFYAYDQSLLISGKWVLKRNSSIQSDKTYAEQGNPIAFVDTSTVATYKPGYRATEIECWHTGATASSVTTENRITSNTLNALLRLMYPIEVSNYPGGFNSPPLFSYTQLTWKWVVACPTVSTVRCFGVAVPVTLRPKVTNPPQPSITVTPIGLTSLSHSYRATNLSVEVVFDQIIPIGEFGYTVTINNTSAWEFNPTPNGFFNIGLSTVTQSQATIGISSASVWKIVTPEITVKPVGGTRTITFNGKTHTTIGNIGHITHAPAADIQDTCVWLGKTYPLIRLNPPVSELNQYAASPAPTGNPEVNTVTPAIDYVLPIYPFRKSDETKPLQGEQFLERGCLIYRVHITRSPVLNGEIFEYPSNSKRLNINLGFMRGATFVSLESVQMGGDENEVELATEWLVFNPEKLVYVASEKVLIQANVTKVSFLENQGNTVDDISSGLDSFYSGSVTQNNLQLPMLAEHYNETVLMLNQLN